MPADLEELKAALERDDAAGVRELLGRDPQLKAKVNEPLLAFDSPAIMHVRSRAMLDVLLDAGADINARSRWWAGSFGLLDCAEPELAAYAIERGAVVDAHAAARLGRIDRLRELVAADPALVHARGGDGQTPLHFAGTVEVAAFLLDHGAAIDALCVDHESTAAQYMVRDRQAVARYLVERGCRTDILMAAALGDVERVRRHLDEDLECIRLSVTEAHFPKRDPRAGGTIYIWTLGWNQTPHRLARRFGHEEVFALLMERSPAELKLAQACELGDEETFKALLASRPGLVESLSADDRGKLATAAQDRNIQAVRLMLAAGWPVDARGQHGGTALHWAAWHGDAELVREILKYGPPIEDAENDFQATPLGWATHGSENGWYRKSGDYAGTVELLCAAGAKVTREAGTQTVRQVLRRYGVGQ
ncbi:MAG TPA: ankyrin repeat domain-containing protein [Tepidisphaeraceae bacterium]|jgi:ankyrin repeat protein